MTDMQTRQDTADALAAAATAYASRPDIDTRRAFTVAHRAAMIADMPAALIEEIISTSTAAVRPLPVAIR